LPAREKILSYNLSEEFDRLEIYPLSDLHYGDPVCDVRAFERFAANILSEPNRYIVSIGDNVNNATRSSVSNVYNETVPPREQKKWLIERLEPLKSRILCFLDGNHEYRNTKDVDNSITYDIADKLNMASAYADNEAVIKVTFGSKSSNGKRNSYVLYCTHGAGGGKRPGSAVNNIELLGLSIDADCYIIGHVHKRMAYKSTFRRVDTQNNVIVPIERLFVVSGAWSDFAGYAARKMLTPGSKGSVPIILSGREKRAEAIV
jgi:predicted MPP superfamily phosphohydrolase